MAVAPTPVAAAPDAPDRAQRATFSARATAFFDWIKNTFVAGVNALASVTYSNAIEAATQATAAAASASAASGSVAAAQSSAAQAALYGGAAAHNPATNYAVGAVVKSNVNYAPYKCRAAGIDASDPSANADKWKPAALEIDTGHPVVRPTLNLNFAQASSVDPRITFTRASTATRTNSRGLVEAVASGPPRIDFDPVTLACRGLLVEESRTNLLTYSQDFDNAAWAKAQATITANAITAPDGSVTADKLVENTANGAHAVYQGAAVVSGSVYVQSVFVKAGERTKFSISFNSNNAAFVDAATVFNLTSGVVESSNAEDAGITACGNGWYRCWSKKTATASANSVRELRCYTSSEVYTGDGTSGLFLWGAQLEAGAFPTSYIPSAVTHTGRASTATFIGSNGLIQTAASGAARYSYNPLNLSAAPALLLEAAATNLLTYSGAVAGTNWSLDTCTATLNNASAPDGTTTATLLNDASASVAGHVSQVITVAVADTTTYTFSCYVKQGTAAKTGISFFALGGSPQNAGGTFTEIEWATGVVTTTANGTATNVGNGWWRLTAVYTNTANTSLFCRVYPAGRHPESTTTGTCYAWGAQLEAGSYPTSYIPTTASQVTRAADTSTSAATTRAADVAVMTGSNFSSWYRQDEGTFVVAFSIPHVNTPTGVNEGVFSATDGNATSNSDIKLFRASASPTYYSYVDSGGVIQASIGTKTVTSANQLVRSTLAYKANDIAVTADGSSASSDTTATLPYVDRLLIGQIHPAGGWYLNGHIRSLRYYPKRLTNTELQTLTQE